MHSCLSPIVKHSAVQYHGFGIGLMLTHQQDFNLGPVVCVSQGKKEKKEKAKKEKHLLCKAATSICSDHS